MPGHSPSPATAGTAVGRCAPGCGCSAACSFLCSSGVRAAWTCSCRGCCCAVRNGGGSRGGLHGGTRGSGTGSGQATSPHRVPGLFLPSLPTCPCWVAAPLAPPGLLSEDALGRVCHALPCPRGQCLLRSCPALVAKAEAEPGPSCSPSLPLARSPLLCSAWPGRRRDLQCAVTTLACAPQPAGH